MRIERSFGQCFKYSLHDARVQKMEHRDSQLMIDFDHIFSHEEKEGENIHKARIIFNQIEVDDIDILVFNDILSKDFQGRYIDLRTYQNDYADSEFEIITETYNWGKAVFQGYLWIDNGPVYCIMVIFFKGPMIYEIKDWNRDG